MPDINLEKYAEVESLLQHGEVISLNMQNPEFATEAEQFFQKRNVDSVVRWHNRMYRWDQVKDIPINERMATPFQQRKCL